MPQAPVKDFIFHDRECRLNYLKFVGGLQRSLEKYAEYLLLTEQDNDFAATRHAGASRRNYSPVEAFTETMQAHAELAHKGTAAAQNESSTYGLKIE